MDSGVGQDKTSQEQDASGPHMESDSDNQSHRVTTVNKAVSGVRWSFIALLVRQVGRLGFALFIARLLGPTDFGIAGEATIYIALTAVLLESGFGMALVQKPDTDHRDEGAVFVWSMVPSLLMAVATLLLAPAVADLLNTPELTAMLRVLCIGLVFKALSVVPQALLSRALRFRPLAVAEITATLLAGAMGIAAAIWGLGYWSLVVQQLAADFLFMAILVAYTGAPVITTTRAAIKGVRKFGGQVMIGQIIGYFTRNLDSVVIAKFLGAVPLAFYMVAYRVMLVPVALLGSIANRVGFPVFARLQHNLPEVRRFFLRITETVAFAVIPMMLIVAALAPQVVQVLFGSAWAGAAVPMQILAFNGIMQVLVTSGGALFLGLGRSDLSLKWAIIPMVVSTISFFAGLPWGVTGVAAAYTIATYLLAPFMLHAIGGLIGMTLGDWMRAVRPAAVGGLTAVAVAVLTRVGLTAAGADDWVIATVGGALASAAYVLVLRFVWPETFFRGIRAVKKLGTPSGRSEALAS